MTLTVTALRLRFSWPRIAAHYAGTGAPGLTYFRDSISEALLAYDGEGNLSGVLAYFPEDVANERAGNFHIVVNPKQRRRGVGTKLLREAVRRWPINFEQQNYTLEGAWLVQHFLSE